MIRYYIALGQLCSYREALGHGEADHRGFNEGQCGDQSHPCRQLLWISDNDGIQVSFNCFLLLVVQLMRYVDL